MMINLNSHSFIVVLFLLVSLTFAKEDLCSNIPNLHGHYKCQYENFLAYQGISDVSSYNRTQNNLRIEANELNSSSQLYDDLVSIFNHNSNKTYKKLELYLSQSNLGNFESGLPRQFSKKLVFLSFYQTNINFPAAIESLRKSNVSLSALQGLRLRDVNLPEIPENLFIDMPKLKFLYLENNGLEKINENSLEPLANSLISIEFNDNELTSLPKALLSLKRINFIYLFNNPIDINVNETVQVVNQLSSQVSSLGITMKDCPCSLASTPFFKAYKARYFVATFCMNPPSLKLKQIRTLTQKDLCPSN